MRAGGIRLDNPASEQAQGPPTNPVEMGNLDIATYVYKISISKEAKFFEQFWGKGSLSSIKWPPGIEQLAATPGPGPANNPNPVLAMLSPADQNLVISAFDHAASQRPHTRPVRKLVPSLRSLITPSLIQPRRC